ncbi:MAG TPA: Glu/Leu/Phe/Val dehydrogenase dimerization domain-containing protein [Symbiobacteriaceae bacterium]|nr:Glu/Leu/Phe/Val dehydrogenase dimerization domain-containing protein [Symbiobacteriaceae bacterium]
MGVFERMQKDGHEQVIFCYDKVTGLKAIIAIHDTTLGPALGGCRMWPYDSEDAALEDAFRLSKGMTYKSAASGQNHGGGKSVIWGNPKTDKSEEFFRAFGRFVETLGGRFITGTDVGTEKTDFVWSAMESNYLVALPEEHGGSGDSSIITAFGAWKGMKACAMTVWGADSLKGKRVAVQGVGKVGYHLVEHLVDEGAVVTICDVVPENVKRAKETFPGITAVEPDAIYDVPCDIFSPNALGGIINDDTIARLTCKVVAGAANNQLKEPRHGDDLYRRGILYAPDYVINAGGLIQVADELLGYNRDRAFRKTAEIYDRLLQIFDISRREQVPTYLAADRLAERRIARVGALNRIYVPE